MNLFRSEAEEKFGGGSGTRTPACPPLAEIICPLVKWPNDWKEESAAWHGA